MPKSNVGKVFFRYFRFCGTFYDIIDMDSKNEDTDINPWKIYTFPTGIHYAQLKSLGNTLILMGSAGKPEIYKITFDPSTKEPKYKKISSYKKANMKFPDIHEVTQYKCPITNDDIFYSYGGWKTHFKSYNYTKNKWISHDKDFLEKNIKLCINTNIWEQFGINPRGNIFKSLNNDNKDFVIITYHRNIAVYDILDKKLTKLREFANMVFFE